MEKRAFNVLEMRASEEGEGEQRKISGYAAVFDKLSEPMWGFREKIQHGAFKKTLQEADIRALWNHNTSYVLGRNKNDTLTLAEDANGLAIEIVLPDTTFANDAYESIKRGDVDQMSFGFRVIKEEWQEGEDGGDALRIVKEIELFEVSPVTFPAYPQTDIHVRDALLAMKEAFKTEPPPAGHSFTNMRKRLELLESEVKYYGRN